MTLRKRNKYRLATRCCCCGRLLLDPQSIETGIGPTCAKKYGFSTRFKALSGAKRAEISGMIHEAGFACEFDDYAEVLKLADEIEKAGFDMVGKRVRSRFLGIRLMIVEDQPIWGWDRDTQSEYNTGRRADMVRLWTPYSEEFTSLRKSNRLRGRPCKKVTDWGKFHWDFEVTLSPLLMRVLVLAFPGRSYICDKGVFKVPTPDEFNAMFDESRVKLISDDEALRIENQIAAKAVERFEMEAQYKARSGGS